MNDSGPNCLAAQECRGDFWLMLQEAMSQCSGNPDAILSGVKVLGFEMPPMADLPLREVVDVLAQNGIRMVYLPEKHIERIRAKENRRPERTPTGGTCTTNHTSEI